MLDPIQILTDRANSCTRAEDGAWWILTSAAARLNGNHDDDGSTADFFFWRFEDRTPWRPCRDLRGYEWRINRDGRFEMRQMGRDSENS
jgi:hypothetical protein